MACCFPRVCDSGAGEPVRSLGAAALSLPQFPGSFSPTHPPVPPPGTRGSSPGPFGIRVKAGAQSSRAKVVSAVCSREGAMAGPGEVGRGRIGSGRRWEAGWRGVDRGPAQAQGARPAVRGAVRRSRLLPLATRGPSRPWPRTWRGLAPGKEKEGSLHRAGLLQEGKLDLHVTGGSLNLPQLCLWPRAGRFLERHP